MKEDRAQPQQEKPVHGELLTVEEGAKYIRMGKTLFYECLKKGLFSYYRPSKGKILIDSAVLDDWLRKSEVPAGTTLPGNI